MDKSSEMVPKAFHSSKNPTILTIADYLRKIGVRVRFKELVFPDAFEVSDRGGVLILHEKQPERSISEIYDKTNEFLGKYPKGIIVFHKYPKSKLALEILGLFMRIALDFGKGVLPSLNSEHTALAIKSLAKRVQIRDNPPALNRVKPAMQTIADAQSFFLEGLINCGPKKAKALMEMCESPIHIIKILEEINRNNEKQKTIINSIEGIGSKFLEQNSTLIGNRIFIKDLEAKKQRG